MAAVEWAAGSMAGWRLDRGRIPWMKGFTAKRGYYSILDEELDAFDTFTAPALDLQLGLLSEIAAAAGAVSASAQVRLGAAAAAGVAVPQTPAALDISGLPTAEQRQSLCDRLRAEDTTVDCYHSEIHFRDGRRTAVLRFCDSNTDEGAAPQQLADALRMATAEHPQIRRVSKVLTHVLWQSSLLGGGGLTAPAIIIMVSAALRWREAASGGGEAITDADLLRSSLLLYGQAFKSDLMMVTMNGVPPLDDAHSPQPGGLWVAHPANPSINIAAGCHQLVRTQRMLLHCAAALSRWDGPRDAVPLHPGSKSPLASVIAFNKLATAYCQPPLPPPVVCCAPTDWSAEGGPPPLLDEVAEDTPQDTDQFSVQKLVEMTGLNPHATPFAPPAQRQSTDEHRSSSRRESPRHQTSGRMSPRFV